MKLDKIDVKGLSKYAHVSKVSVYKHYKEVKNDPKYKDCTVTEHNKLYFKQPLINYLIKSFDKSHVNAKTKTLDTSELIKSLIESNKHLEKLLDQQQQLQLSTNAENKDLKYRVKHLKAISGTVDVKRNHLNTNNVSNNVEHGNNTSNNDKHDNSSKTKASHKPKKLSFIDKLKGFFK